MPSAEAQHVVPPFMINVHVQKSFKPFGLASDQFFQAVRTQFAIFLVDLLDDFLL